MFGFIWIQNYLIDLNWSIWLTNVWWSYKPKRGPKAACVAYTVYMYLVLFDLYLKQLWLLYSASWDFFLNAIWHKTLCYGWCWTDYIFDLFLFQPKPIMPTLAVKICIPTCKMMYLSLRVGTEVHPISPRSTHFKIPKIMKMLKHTSNNNNAIGSILPQSGSLSILLLKKKK